MKSPYSDEMINAFVDDELDSRERESIKQAMKTDETLYQRVSSVCDLKKSLKHSYSDISFGASSVRKETVSRRSMAWPQAVAVALSLGLGVLMGWYAGTLNGQFASTDTIQGLKLNAVNLQESNKIILHVSSSDGNTLERTMQKVELIIDEYRRNHLPFEMEIIANSGGIDLLRQDVSPYRDRIENIINTYENVSFIACSNTIEKLQTQGIEPRIIAHTKTGRTAVDQIVRRLQQGWIYVKV